ncbi:MAG: DUF4294 domain-containing protein [Dysgonamonadaceae bacterium]|jgi:hypothetical protein|nr:DUF4294 domain-containing protein [Dysgonamonadaceae bacterium]
MKKLCYFCTVKQFYILSILLISCASGTKTFAQNTFKSSIPAYAVDKGDSMKVLVMNDIYVYPPQMYRNFSEDAKHQKMVRDVKKTLPYAKMIYTTLIETYEYIMTMPSEEERRKHLARMESDLFKEYKPVLKKMSLSQGKLLIKLVDRECNQTSYDLVKAFLGPFRAGFWNIFAGMFGASLKSNWDPEGRDAATERIVEMVEMGLL